MVNQTMQLVRDDAAMESIIAKVMELQDRENTNLPLYEKQLRDAESGIQNMLNAIQAGILTSSTKERLEQLEETKRELEARIAEEKLAKPKIKEEFIRFWLMRFRKLDMSLKDQRQALVDTFINSIYLYDDKVLITFNYKEGTQTITFEEAAQAASKENGSDLDCFTAPDKKDPNLFSKEKGSDFLFADLWRGVVPVCQLHNTKKDTTRSLRRTSCSGAFVLLDATVNTRMEGAGYSRAGLYVQKGGADTPTVPLLLYRGSADVGKTHSVMPHRKWRMEFQTDQFPDYDRWMTPSSTPLYQAYTLTERFSLPGTSEEVQLFLLPLRGRDGTMYGLCGFEISQSFFKQNFAQPTGFDT